MTQEKVFVGLSGGVDSAVAAKRLIDAGHSVVGVFIKVWQPDFIECTWKEERLDAMRVAAHLGIPFTTFDAADAYKKEVADVLIREYREGRTPNPDILCNEHVKFGVFMDYALSSGATRVATGHYARVREHDGQYELLRGVDATKDQSYFLSRLSREQLSHTLFPIGDSLKEDVRAEAKNSGIPTHAKHDSQGICFLGPIDMKDFLSHYIPERPGVMKNEQGDVVGHHRGIEFYTVGERVEANKTISDSSTPTHYVIRKDIETNTLIVSESTSKVSNNEIAASNIVMRDDGLTTKYDAQFRYRQPPFPVTITERSKDYVKLMVDSDTVDTPSIGQTCAFYNEDVCIGAGIIS